MNLVSLGCRSFPPTSADFHRLLPAAATFVGYAWGYRRFGRSACPVRRYAAKHGSKALVSVFRSVATHQFKSRQRSRIARSARLSDSPWITSGFPFSRASCIRAKGHLKLRNAALVSQRLSLSRHRGVLNTICAVCGDGHDRLPWTTEESANADCNHLATPRVFYLLSAIVPRCQARPGAITCWSRG